MAADNGFIDRQTTKRTVDAVTPSCLVPFIGKCVGIYYNAVPHRQPAVDKYIVLRFEGVHHLGGEAQNHRLDLCAGFQKIAWFVRREWNPNCTNMDEQRPRIIYLSNCKNVQIEGISIANSPFWTTHYYKCSYVKLLNLHITSPRKPMEAPSTDAVDLDVCNNVLIKNCYMSVCDDAVALKGGKGPWADKDVNNGGNYDIVIEDCRYGYCHSALTCGSESIHNRNVIFRRSTMDQARILLHLKMRPDTPQKYEYILVEDIKGNAGDFIYVAPWTQFYNLGDRKDIPISYSNNITMRNIDLDCTTFFNVKKSDQYRLSDFCFEDLNIRAKKGQFDKDIVDRFVVKNVKVNSQEVR